MSVLGDLAEPVRAVLDEVLSRREPLALVDWEAVRTTVAERTGLDLREVDMAFEYRRTVDVPPDLQVVLRDHSDPSGDVELTITHSVWAHRLSRYGPDPSSWTLGGQVHRV